MSLANLKKGDTVILHMFTGIAVGVKEVLAADKNTVTLETRIGKAKFSRKTGKQVEPKAKQDRFANYITEDDGSYVPTGAQAKPTSKKKAKKADDKKAKSKAKAKAEEAEEDDDDEDYEEEEEAPVTPKKKSKKAPAPAPKKKPTKKSKPEPEDEDEDEDEEYEEEE